MGGPLVGTRLWWSIRGVGGQVFRGCERAVKGEGTLEP